MNDRLVASRALLTMRLGARILLLAALSGSSCGSVLHNVKREVAGKALLPRSISPVKEVKSRGPRPWKESPKAATSHVLKQLVTQRSGAMNEQQSELVGISFFVLTDILMRKLFLANGIKFPSQLAGCCILFAVLALASALVCPHFADAVAAMLTPGAGWLAKWLPVFFVPGLAMLPLAPPIGSAVEIVKVLSVVAVGFVFSLVTTVYAVLGMNSLLGNAPVPFVEAATTSGKTTATNSPPPKPFSAELLKTLLTGCAITGAMSVGTARSNHALRNPIQSLFMILITVSAYVFGARLPSQFTKIVHPLVTSTGLTLAATQLLGLLTGRSFESVLQDYKSGSLSFYSAGAGDILLFMLGPAVVSFAIAMYSRKKLIKDNLPVLGTGMITASFGGLFGTAAFVRLINMASSMVRLSVLPRNVTTPLAIAITQILGGDISIAASVVVLTGILGATAGASVLNALKIGEPIARGLGIGASAQGLGVASMVNEKDAFPFAAVSMILTALCATTLVSIAPIKKALTDLALAA